MSSVEALKAKVKQLEEELALEKSRNLQNAPARGKIAQMSSEVVDSNPYRLGIRVLTSVIKLVGTSKSVNHMNENTIFINILFFYEGLFWSSLLASHVNAPLH